MAKIKVALVCLVRVFLITRELILRRKRRRLSNNEWILEHLNYSDRITKEYDKIVFSTSCDETARKIRYIVD